MSDRQLRAGLIRLAHTRPDLREHLLPLLGEGSPNSKVAAKRGDVVVLSAPIPDFTDEKTVPRGTYAVTKSGPGEVVLRPYPLRPSDGGGYLVRADVLAKATAGKTANASKRASETLTIGPSTQGADATSTFLYEAAKVAFGKHMVQEVTYTGDGDFQVEVGEGGDDYSGYDGWGIDYVFSVKRGFVTAHGRGKQYGKAPFDLWGSSVADAARVMKRIVPHSPWAVGVPSDQPGDVPPLQETHSWAYTER